jgi:hypothetical protein
MNSKTFLFFVLAAVISTTTNAQNWLTSGNSLGLGSFLGSTNNMDVVIKTNNIERMRITGTAGEVGIGTAPVSTYKLAVGGYGRFGIGGSTGQIDLKPDGITSLDLASGSQTMSYLDFKGSAHLASDYWGRIKYTDGTGFAFQTAGSATDRLTISETGIVGVNLGAAPILGLTFDVNGLGRFSYAAGYVQINPVLGGIDLGSPGGTGTMIDFKGSTHLATDWWGRILHTDGVGFDFLTGGSYTRMRIKEDGKVVIGDPTVITSTASGYKLFVQDGILTEKVKVAVHTTSDWSDYVFAPNYELLSLDSVNTYINENCHLPGVPSADAVVNNGIDMAKMDATLLQKIEELTLYVIQLDKDNRALKSEVEMLKNK